MYLCPKDMLSLALTNKKALKVFNSNEVWLEKIRSLEIEKPTWKHLFKERWKLKHYHIGVYCYDCGKTEYSRCIGPKIVYKCPTNAYHKTRKDFSHLLHEINPDGIT